MGKKDCGNHGGGCHDDHYHKLYWQIFKGVLVFVVLVLLAILIVWLVLRPTKPRFTLRDATVLNFNLTTTGPTLLSTTLQITVASRNPNSRIGIYYDHLDVFASYKSEQITLAAEIPPTYQGHDDVDIWSPFLYGVSVPIAPFLCNSLVQDMAAGIIMLYIKFDGRLRWKVGSWTSDHYHVFVNCPAILLINGKGGSGAGNGRYTPSIKFQQMSQCSVDI